MLDWIFEGIVTWISSVMTSLMDAVSGLFLNALGTDMIVMEEYFPFVTKAYGILQYTAWALLFLITAWQLFRSFGGPISEAENPLTLLARSMLFAVMIGYARSIFQMTLDIARAPYLALMDVSMTAEDFTFAGIEEALKNGLVTIVATTSVVGMLLLVILEISLGWNYFKLLLETVERYVVVGVLCYTSPLSFAMGGSKETNSVFRSWCRMVGSQLILLIMNVWFLRAFNSSVGQFIGNGGALTNGQGSIFLWLFCALAFLKCAQRFDRYLSSMGLSVAQTGSSMGMELLMAARTLSGFGGKTAGSIFRGSSAAGAAHTTSTATSFAAGFANRFKGNSYVRDAVVNGGTRMGAGGSVGFVGRAFGGIAARNGASLSGESIASVASRPSAVSGSIGGEIADRSLQNYMPQLAGRQLKDTQISGGRISTKAVSADGKQTSVEMYNASQFDRPAGPHALVTASDGSQWYQVARGPGAGAFYDAPHFNGSADESAQVAAFFPDAPEGTMLRSVGEGEIEAISPDGTSSMWYNSALFEEPDSPHSVMESANGVDWYAMQPSAEAPGFESGVATNGVQPDMGVGSFSASEVPPQSLSDFPVSGADFSPPVSTGESFNSPVAVDSAYSPSPSSETPIGAEPAPLGADAPGFADYGGVEMPGQNTPPGNPVTTVDTPLSDTETFGSYDFNAGEPGTGFVPQYGSSDVSMGIPQTGLDVQGGSDLSMGGADVGFASQYGPADAGMDISQTDAGTLGSYDFSQGDPGPDHIAAASQHEPASAGNGVDSDVSAPFVPAPQHDVHYAASQDVSPAIENYSQRLPDSHGSVAADDGEPRAAYSSPPVNAEPSPTGSDETPSDQYVHSGNRYYASSPAADSTDAAAAYNQALFQSFMPGYERSVVSVDGSGRSEGHFEVRHADGSGTMFFDSTRYAEPRGEHKTFEDRSGGKWYAVTGEPAVERRPVYENGKPVYEGENVKTISVETVRYRNLPTKHSSPAPRRQRDGKNPKKK